MKKRYTIDRIEDDIVMIEDEQENIIKISRDLIEGDFKEGSILCKEEFIFKVMVEEGISRKEKISKKVKGMWIE